MHSAEPLSAVTDSPLGYPCAACAAKVVDHYCDGCRAARRRTQKYVSTWRKKYGAPTPPVVVDAGTVGSLLSALDLLEQLAHTAESIRAGRTALTADQVATILTRIETAWSAVQPVVEAHDVRRARQLRDDLEQLTPRASTARPTDPKP